MFCPERFESDESKRVVCRRDDMRSVLQQSVRADALRRVDRTWNRADITPDLVRGVGRDERTAFLGRFDDNREYLQRFNYSIAPRK